MAEVLQVDFKTYVVDATTGLKTFYRFVGDYDTQGTRTTLTVYDLQDNVVVPSSEIVTRFETQSDYIQAKGGVNSFDTVLSSENGYPNTGNFNAAPTSHSGGGGT